MTDFPSHLVDAYRRRYPSAWILGFLGYNPQHLLTDQRSELAKFAALHRPLGETYQPILTDPPYHHGGVFIPARRMGKTEAMQAALPAGEHVIPISRLHRYGMGTKKLADAFSSVGYSAQIAIEAQDRFTASMKRVQEQMARWQEKVMLRMLLAVENPEYPSPMFRREMRIAKLLFSNDPRQRKRGDRLFNRWRETRSGINWTRDEKRELLRRGYGRARPFDYTVPKHYEKD
ncbi:MAG: hypothetical protein CMG88_03700 [Marinobacter sp.]|nr:hypothetical protein [Marinobacter sp.]MBP53649.1 hypothetical protein [Marinobacter sp.]|tara:strand:- start:7992 stop:8687 length:696 start_codon:yes stop_codon:yes gene_type:complete